MRCDRCGDQEAEVHLTQIEQGELDTVHLCEACADEKGVTAESVGEAPLADFLAEMGKDESQAMLPAASESCPYCGTSPADFRRTGRLGCAQCWVHFDEQLEALVRRIHGSTEHVGKLYLGDAADTQDRRTRLSRLRRRLRRAVETEDFETAADLRDQIDELEPVDG